MTANNIRRVCDLQRGDILYHPLNGMKVVVASIDDKVVKFRYVGSGSYATPISVNSKQIIGYAIQK